MSRPTALMRRENSVKQLLSGIASIRHSLTIQGTKKRDPAEYDPCDILTVKVIRGRNITHGYLDYIDTPDPYIELHLPHAAIPCKRTKYIEDCTEPVWNEEFTFYIDQDDENEMEISLMDSNWVKDETVETLTFNLKELKYDVTMEKTFTFNNGNGSEVDMTFHLKKNDDPPDLRYSLDLCEQEEAFLRARKKVVLENMKKMFGKEAPKTESEVPNISVIGSGGGFRAMVGMTGVFKALADHNILDVTTYVAALSGSSWYLSTLYSEPNFPARMGPNDQDWINDLRDRIDQSILWLFSPNNIMKHYDQLKEKSKRGQPVTFTDIFGCMVGDTLIPNRIDSCLSDQRRLTDTASVPLPLYDVLHVKSDVSASFFSEHVEFNPYEVGMEKYGVYMDSTLFGSKFYSGKLIRKHPESKLHYLQGVLGSAFTILFNRLLDKNPKDSGSVIEEQLRTEMEKSVTEELSDPEAHKDVRKAEMNEGVEAREGKNKDEADGKEEESWMSYISNYFNASSLYTSRQGRAAVVHNFLRKIKLKTEAIVDGVVETGVVQLSRLFLVDAGLSFNSPYPMVLRDARQVDLILSFDFSWRDTDDFPPFKELLLAELWAKENKKPFPPIDPTIFEKVGLQELYIFEDPNDLTCPMVFHFPLVNKKFKEFKRPNEPRVTEEEKAYADFDIFAEGSPYSTFNFNYPHEAFDKLVKLMEFNTLLHMDQIKEAILRRSNLKKGINTPISPLKYMDDRYFDTPE